jgi:hypothetical protein
MSTIDRVDSRARLKPRRDPYWQRLTSGRYVGFRRMAAGTPGTWLARYYDGERYRYETLGDFADKLEKDRFDEAKIAAELYFQHVDMGGTGERITVKKACELYVEKLELEKSKAAATDAKGRFTRLVYDDPLARVELKKLAPRHLAEWKTRVLSRPRKSKKLGSKAVRAAPVERADHRGSFNRNATALRAALNLAHERRDVPSDYAWAVELKRFENADGRRDLYLKRPARAKLLEKASAEAQRFLKALLLQPLRPGDVAKLKVQHFDAHHGNLAVPTGKTTSRIIPLGSEAVTHFKECSKDKLPGAWLISRDGGAQWKKEDWRDAIHDATTAAKLPKATCAYTLRHCVITDLVTGGLDLFTVAKLAGTSVEMIEKHYGHLQREHARRALEGLALK